MSTVIVIAKETLPGKVKTRLHPDLSYEDAAGVAAAALADTMLTVQALPATRRILLFDGTVLPPWSEHFEIVPQTSGGLDERIGAAFDAATGRTVLIGMDTPQVTAAHLDAFFTATGEGDAWMGPANDGGWWALGMEEPRGDLIRGVPMSTDVTGAAQLVRLRGAGLRVEMLPTLTDIDTVDDALDVARTAPESRFALALTMCLTPARINQDRS